MKLCQVLCRSISSPIYLINLIAALRHAVKLCDSGLPAIGLILDVLDEDALAFYQCFDFFHALTDDPMRLFFSMKTLREI